MANFNIGELIKTLRKQKGLSQEDLAGGFMDRGNLSKIENGTVMPNKKTLEAIFERLGFDPYSAVNYYLDDEMAETQRIMDELDSHLAYKRTGEADALIKQLEENGKFMQNNINRQYVMCAKASSAIDKKENPENILETLVSALKISIPVFYEKYIGDYLLSKHELRAVNMIATVYYNMKQYEKAIDIMYGLKESFEKNCIDATFRGKNYPMIVNNLVLYLTEVKKYREALELCDIAKRVCLDTGQLYLMPFIIMNKVACLHELGDIDSCERYIRQVYYIYDAYEMFDLKKNVKNYAERKLGIVL